VFGVYLAATEWLRESGYLRPHPVVFTIAAVAIAGFAIWRMFRLRPVLRALRLGIDGEKVVGQFLERLREQGYQVFHDVVAPGFNVDHVLVGPGGVFTVETKTRSKPVRGEPRIRCDGESLTVAGHEPDRDPIRQARGQAAWLRKVLSESTGRDFPVAPVILFPGWFIENSPGSLRQIWVLEPKALPAFLQGEPQRLEHADASLASYHLSRYIRGIERERDPARRAA
jgi:nuclease-like protein